MLTQVLDGEPDLCMRCVQVCDKIQDMHIWDVAGTGSRTTVDVSGNRLLKNTDCTYCGQCITHCPTGALTARDNTNKVFRALADPVRYSHENPDVQAHYQDYLGAPLGSRSHHLLHTDHTPWTMPDGTVPDTK